MGRRTTERLGEALRVPVGGVDLAARDPAATPGFRGGKDDARAALAALAEPLAAQQELLYANGAVGGACAFLLMLQGTDTSGKSSTIKAVTASMNPQGVNVAAFRAPTAAEQAEPPLTRYRRALPAPGRFGVFDRSHYEGVLIERVRALAAPDVLEARYDSFLAFEADAAAAGIVVVKVFLHLSYDEQRRRILDRLEDPTKHWKFNPHDLDERALWPAYQEAYEAALARCSTQASPWYLVPADRNAYRKWAVAQLVLEHLQAMGLTWPPADFDVDEQRRRLQNEGRAARAEIAAAAGFG